MGITSFLGRDHSVGMEPQESWLHVFDRRRDAWAFCRALWQVAGDRVPRKAMFVAATCLTVPACLKDLFMGDQVSAIEGRLLTALSVTGVVALLICDALLDHYKADHQPLAQAYTFIFAHHGLPAAARLLRKSSCSSGCSALLDGRSDTASVDAIQH